MTSFVTTVWMLPQSTVHADMKLITSPP